MGWNDLTPEEQRWVERNELAEAEIKTAIQHWRAYVGEHTCRYREEEGDDTFSNGVIHYPDHPTCLVCGEEEEMEVYCHTSPDRICHFVVDELVLAQTHGPDREKHPKTLTSSELLNLEVRHNLRSKDDRRRIDASICIHCNQTFERSY